MTNDITYKARELITTFGKVRFNMKEVGTMLHISRPVLPKYLNDNGILCQTNGREKYINVWDLAECLTKNLVSPIQK